MMNFNGRPDGQMSELEKRVLYATVLIARPSSAIEIGTWKGGGSTRIISSALIENGHGNLRTFEINSDFYAQAVALYHGELAPLAGVISFYRMDFMDYSLSGGVDFVLFDGDENAEATLAQVRKVEPLLAHGSVLAFHDWRSNKARLAEPYLASKQNEYYPLCILQSDTGFATWLKV